MKGIRQPDPAMVAAAKKLFLKYEGREHERIVEEMRAGGFPHFYRELLYSKKRQYGVRQGLVEQFGWIDLLPEKKRKGLVLGGAGRNRFENWLQRTQPDRDWREKHQRHIYGRLNEITQGRSNRLMIFMPPRHGKTEMVTIGYTAWRLLQDPKLNVIIGSYGQKLANKFSRSIKRIVLRADELPPRPRDADTPRSGTNGVPVLVQSQPTEQGGERLKRLNAASEWETAGGGVVRAVGVGGGIAGFGAGLIVIDDPVKNRAQAESEAYRDRVWEWFNDDIYTRMEPDASIILIQTRWHEDDLAGRLLKEMEDGGEQWDVISLPALAEDGGVAAEIDETATEKQSFSANRAAEPRENADPLGRKAGQALWPKRFPVKKLLKYQRKLGSYSFSAMYQQRPAPAEGGQFKRSWFTKIIDAPPPGLVWKRGYDLAVSTKQTADYTASFRCAKDTQGNLYIADGFRARIEYPDQRRYILERMRAETSTEHGIEAALHGQAFVQDLRREAGLGRIAFRAVRVDADKLTRALAWLNLAEEGKVYLVRGPWIDAFIDEVARFPTGRHDDQIDAVSLAVNMIERRRFRSAGFAW